MANTVKFQFRITKEHLVTDGKPIHELSKATNKELEAYISENLRYQSPKTGKWIKVNTFHKTKPYFLEVIKAARAEKKAIE